MKQYIEVMVPRSHSVNLKIKVVIVDDDPANSGGAAVESGPVDTGSELEPMFRRFELYPGGTSNTRVMAAALQERGWSGVLPTGRRNGGAASDASYIRWTLKTPAGRQTLYLGSQALRSESTNTTIKSLLSAQPGADTRPSGIYFQIETQEGLDQAIAAVDTLMASTTPAP